MHNAASALPAVLDWFLPSYSEHVRLAGRSFVACFLSANAVFLAFVLTHGVAYLPYLIANIIVLLPLKLGYVSEKLFPRFYVLIMHLLAVIGFKLATALVRVNNPFLFYISIPTGMRWRTVRV